MKFAPCVLAVVLALTAAGCAQPYYGNGYNSGPGYSPNYAYAPQYSNETPSYSKWDYYRLYGGTYHPEPEQYP